MARPLSPEKRDAILAAATEVIAEQGVSAPTAKISKLAGVAEGTLFTYFHSKDAMLNALYVALKTELGVSMGKRYPSTKGEKERARHLWNRYVQWGAKAPLKYRALRQLAVAECITEESRQLGRACLGQMCDVLLDGAAARSGLSPEFAGALFGAVADTSLDLATREPKRSRQYTRAGFEAFWRAVGGK